MSLPSPDELTALRLKLRSNGYLPVPVLGAHTNDRNAGKRPVLRAWETVCLTADAAEIIQWAARLRSSVNTGLLCGMLVGVDIDVLNAELATDITELATIRLAATPLRRVGLPPKILLCYRAEAPHPKLATPDLFFEDGQKAAVEVLGEGQQFVALGMHPQTRASYRWLEASPLELSFSELPVVKLEALQEFIIEVEGVLRAAGCATKRERRDGTIEAKARAQQTQKRERKGRIAASLRQDEKPPAEVVADALDHITNDLSYDDWIRVGFSLYDGLGDAGRELWERWSATSSKNNPDYTAGKWPSFADNRSVTIATLFWFAKENGWRRRRLSRDRCRAEASTEDQRDGKSVAAEQGCSATKRPLIRVAGGNLPATVTLGERAIMAAGLEVYQRGSMIVRPTITKVAFAQGQTSKATRLVPVRSHHIAELMTQAADWERFDIRAVDWVPIDCPQRVAETYLAREGHWNVPVLSGVISCPTLRPDGSVLDVPGYDAATGLLLDKQGAEFDPIPDNPSKEAAREALTVLRQLITTFPFVSAHDRAVALSAILTAIVRRSLPTAPMHAFSAPTAGTGKSLLVDIASQITDGRPAAVMSIGRTADEAEKRLGAALIAGDAIVSIDNVERPFGGELYCQALTQTSLKVRVLGLSKLAEVLSNAAIFATGNNFTLLGDMTRRALLCSLDANVERPETREFKNSPLDMVRSDRNRYVNAALTVLRAYHVAGRPQQKSPLGSFEIWSRWVRDALLWLGEADPCATMERARSNDPKLETLVAVMSQWDDIVGRESVSVKSVIDKATEQEGGEENFYGARKSRVFRHAEFREALLAAAGDGGAVNSRRLGRWLAQNQGRIVNGRRFVSAGLREGITHWRLQATSTHPAAQAAAGAPQL